MSQVMYRRQVVKIQQISNFQHSLCIYTALCWLRFCVLLVAAGMVVLGVCFWNLILFEINPCDQFWNFKIINPGSALRFAVFVMVSGLYVTRSYDL